MGKIILHLLTKVEGRIFLLVIGLVFIFKATLVGKGLMYFPDEYRYFSSTDAIKQFFGGNFKASIVSINSTQGRPGDAVCRLLPAIVQAILFKVRGFNINTPSSLVVNAWANFVLLISNAILFWAIAKMVVKNEWAHLGVLLYVCLVNSNLYIRHILPYDEAIFFFLIALLLIVRFINVRQQLFIIFIAGLATGLCYTVYPGYFLAPLFLAIVLLSRYDSSPTLRKVIRLQLVFAAGFLLVIASFEALARIIGKSYLLDSQTLSSTITLGDFSAGYKFVAEYLISVEGLAGISLLLLILLTFYQILLRRKYVLTRALLLENDLKFNLVLSLLLCWLAYATIVFVFHKLVFYGRIVHFFMPIIVLGSVIGLAEYSRKANLLLARYLLLVISVFSFFKFYVAYRGVVYARDVLFENKIYAPLPSDTKFYFTTCYIKSGELPVFQPLYQNQSFEPRFQRGLALINFGYSFPVKCYQPVQVKGQLLAEYADAVEYLPYQYEGYTEAERKLIATHDFTFRLYHQQ